MSPSRSGMALLAGLALLLVCLAAPLSSPAANQNQKKLERAAALALLDEANQRFHQAANTTDADRARQLYRQALARYLRLEEAGYASGKLSYNIGNTFFRLGDLGRAILHYRRAEKVMGDDPNLRHNLAVARSRVPDRFPPAATAKLWRTVFFFHYRLGQTTRFWLLAIAWNLACMLALRRVRRRMPAGTALLAVTAAVALLFAGSLGVEGWQARFRPAGVIVAPEVTARTGDGVGFEAAFSGPLHAGTEFTVVERRGDWLQVEVGDGQRCWLPKEAVLLVR